MFQTNANILKNLTRTKTKINQNGLKNSSKMQQIILLP